MGVQSVFRNDVQSLTVVIHEMGDPLLEERNDMLVLDTKHIMESVAGTVIKVKTISQDQYRKCVDELLSTYVTPVPIHYPETNYHSSATQQ